MNIVIVLMGRPTLLWFSSCPLHRLRVLNEISREVISLFASKYEIISYRWKFSFLKFPRVTAWEPQVCQSTLGRPHLTGLSFSICNVM